MDRAGHMVHLLRGISSGSGGGDEMVALDALRRLLLVLAGVEGLGVVGVGVVGVTLVGLVLGTLEEGLEELGVVDDVEKTSASIVHSQGDTWGSRS